MKKKRKGLLMAADDGYQRFMRMVMADQPSGRRSLSRNPGQFECYGFFCAYLDGQITLKQLCRRVNNVLAVQDLNESQRDGVFGATVRGALKWNPPKRKRGNPGQPKFIRDFSIDLIKHWVSGPVNRSGRDYINPAGRVVHIPSAFDEVAQYWKKQGVPGITPLAVEKWYSSRRRGTTKKK